MRAPVLLDSTDSSKGKEGKCKCLMRDMGCRYRRDGVLKTWKTYTNITADMAEE